MTAVDADPVPMVEVWRGEFAESLHRGHAVVARADGGIEGVWGSAGRIILPRSSMKMIQALPLVESGAADRAGLGSEELALACASHRGQPKHVDRVAAWLDRIGLGEADLRCGVQPPSSAAGRAAMRAAGGHATQLHNNCSGKHTGFLTLARDQRWDLDYIDAGHPVQSGIRQVFGELSGETSPGFGIDGCSAPNFAASVAGLAQAAACMAGATGTRGAAAVRLLEAMMAHPDLVSGDGAACERLMQAASGVAVKTGAEGVYLAIWPARQLGVALKIEDGATRAAEAAMTMLLVHLGAIAADHPVVKGLAWAPIRNRRDIETGSLRPAPGFPA